MGTMSKSLSTRIDRLSSLPDDVAHKIFSSLSMEDIFRLSTLNKRCRQLCISIPNLIFDDSLYQSNEIKRTQLINYLERILVARQGLDIKSFNIHWSLVNYAIEEENQLLSWLHTAVKCHVKQLDLKIVLSSESDFTLPPNLLGCLFLESLVLKFKNGIGNLRIPSSITSPGFSSLKSLELKYVQISDSFGDWVSSYCRFLLKLRLDRIKGAESIIISSSSLKTLEIWLPDDLFRLRVSGEMLSYMVLCWQFDSSPDTRDLQLSTPNLKELWWLGNFLNFRFMENYTSLLTAKIYLRSSSRFASLTQYLDVLRHVHNVRHLSLNESCLFVMSKKQNCLPLIFPSVLTLRLYNIGGSIRDLVPVITSILKKTPNLQCLIISAKKCFISRKLLEYDNTETCQDLENIPFLHNLKSVTIGIPRKRENVLELIKYLLKHAKNLQKMTVEYNSLQSYVCRELDGYEKASSIAEVNFREV